MLPELSAGLNKRASGLDQAVALLARPETSCHHFLLAVNECGHNNFSHTNIAVIEPAIPMTRPTTRPAGLCDAASRANRRAGIPRRALTGTAFMMGRRCTT